MKIVNNGIQYILDKTSDILSISDTDMIIAAYTHGGCYLFTVLLQEYLQTKDIISNIVAVKGLEVCHCYLNVNGFLYDANGLFHPYYKSPIKPYDLNYNLLDPFTISKEYLEFILNEFSINNFLQIESDWHYLDNKILSEILSEFK